MTRGWTYRTGSGGYYRRRSGKWAASAQYDGVYNCWRWEVAEAGICGTPCARGICDRDVDALEAAEFVVALFEEWDRRRAESKKGGE